MRLWIILFLFIVTAQSKTINVAVAANVAYAMKPLVHAFKEKNKDTQVNVILGSSGKLAAQIMHGAPYGVFLSANMTYPQELYENKIAVEKPVIYAQGALVLLGRKNYDFSKGLMLLADKNIQKIAIGNPKTAPYGVAAVEALKYAKLYTLLKPKFVYGESISQTLTYAIRMADAGIVAKSLLYSPLVSAHQADKSWTEIPSSYYTPINQGMVLLKETKENRAFYEFMLSQTAKNILQKYGYKAE